MSKVDGKSTGKLVVVTSNLCDAKAVPVGKVQIAWYDRTTGKRLHVKRTLRHVCAEIVRDLCEYNVAYVFVGTHEEAVDLPRRIRGMTDNMDIVLEAVSFTPASMPQGVSHALSNPQVRAYVAQSSLKTERLEFPFPGIDQFDLGAISLN